jgi:hypothetical protein
MSVAALLARADELGVRVHAVGGDLKARWSASAPPPADLLAALKANKPAILAALSAPSDAGGWRDYFEERAAIREHDGGMSRADAEAGGLADCVARWPALITASDTTTKPEDYASHGTTPALNACARVARA